MGAQQMEGWPLLVEQPLEVKERSSRHRADHSGPVLGSSVQAGGAFAEKSLTRAVSATEKQWRREGWTRGGGWVGRAGAAAERGRRVNG